MSAFPLPIAVAVSAVLCAGLHAAVGAVPVTVDVADASSGATLADAVVYALPASGSHLQRSDRAPGAEIAQVDRAFVPTVSVVQTGTAVAFPNRDKVRHHVYSFSPAKTFELKLYNGTPAEPVVFDKPGVVTLGCNIHDEMLAYVAVVDTPHFGKTGADGSGTLDLPSGDWVVHAWHPRGPALDTDAGVAVSAKRDAVRVRTLLKLAPDR